MTITMTLGTVTPGTLMPSEIEAISLEPDASLAVDQQTGSPLPAKVTTGDPMVRVAFHRGETLDGQFWLSGGDIALPLRVEMHGADHGLTAVQPDTGIFGTGRSLADALNDLRAALVEYRGALTSAQPLAEDLREQLGFLRRHLRTI